MARCLWTLALCLVTSATSMAQSPGDEDADDPRGEERRERREMRRGEEGEEGRRGRDERGRGEEGGRFGMFRRPNPMFEAIDADGDGSITNVELRKAVAALKKLDADGDGLITLAEATPQGGPGGMFGGDPAQMVERIMMQDRNRDGRLTLAEVDERTAMLLQRADLNRDQAIDRAEVEAAVQQMQQRFGGGPGGGFRGRFDAGQMTERMMANDQNRDGKLSPDEVPPQAQQMLRGGDLNEDGFIDASEMEQISRRMGDRFGGRTFGADGPGGPGDRFGERRGRRDRDADDAEEDEEEGGRRGRRQRPETEEE